MILDYTDDNGVQRRVRVQHEHQSPDKGIPVDMYGILAELYIDTPQAFRTRLFNGLWHRGLIERQDFMKPDATKRFRQALNSALARDATDSIRYVMEQTRHDKHQQYNESS